MIPAIPALQMLLSKLPWKWIGIAVGIVLAAWAAVSWHDDQKDAFKIAAMQEQAALDAADFEAAWREAEALQKQEIANARSAAAAVNKEQIDELEAKNDRIGRDYAALRKLWRFTPPGTHPGGTGQGGAVAVPGDASAAAFDTARAAGWLDFETAATLAEAADRNAAGWQAVIDWYLGQCRAWRGPKPDECQ
jgi:hypothetical protein